VKIVVQVQSSTLVVVNITIDDSEVGNASGGGGATSPAACPIISGGKVGSGIELEGNVSSVLSLDPAKFGMTVNGERASASGAVVVDAGAASFKCNGGKPGSNDCKASLKAGDKVHVRGTLVRCDSAEADVTATEVMVQKGA
jgi:hypothetical protein